MKDRTDIYSYSYVPSITRETYKEEVSISYHRLKIVSN